MCTLVTEYGCDQNLENMNSDSQEDLEVCCSTNIKEHRRNLIEVAADDISTSINVIPHQLQQNVKEKDSEALADIEIHIHDSNDINDDQPSTTQL